MWRAFLDTARAALATLTANKLRSALTLLGIVIGVIAVVAMSATIEGLRQSVNHDLAQLGNGVFQVQKHPMNQGGPGGGHGGRRRWEARKNFTMEHVELLEQKCTRCLKVAGEAWYFQGRKQATTAAGGVAPNVTLCGGTTWFFDNNGFQIATGRTFNEGEVRGGAGVVVIGADIVDALFKDQNPIGQEVLLDDKIYRVIGTLEARGSNMGGSMDNLFVLPLGRYLTDYGSRQSLHVTIMVKDPDEMDKAQDEVVALLRRQRGVAPQAENDFEMFSNSSVQKDFQELASRVAAVTTGVCAIALIIGGIGVMNIMLVAVTERTSEIGVRRALGARRRRILGQFVAEAIVLCLFGGAIGVALGWFASYLIGVFTPVPTVVPMWAVQLSLFAAASVGLFFGIYPAWRASRLDPVEAMRHE